MGKIWKYIDRKDWNSSSKYKTILIVFAVLSAVFGFTAWLIIRNWTLSTWDWMICFAVYPVIISWFALFTYSCNHDFHNGSFG